MEKVKNAADEKQVKKDENKERSRDDRDHNDLMFLLTRAEFRRFTWKLMSHCKTFGSTYSPHGSQAAYNSGCQDIGHYLIEKITDADPKAFVKMMEEGLK